MSRPNIDSGDVRAREVRTTMYPVFQTLGGNISLDADLPNWLLLDPGGASRTVTLPAEADGLWFTIINAGSAGELITVNNDAAAAIAVIAPNQQITVACLNDTWYFTTGGQAGAGSGLVEIADAATYTVLAYNTGKIHSIPDLTADIVITLPTPAHGLVYEFMYAGAAADAQDWQFDTGSDTNFFQGGLAHLDSDAGTGAAEVVPVRSDGDSNSKLNVLTPDVGTLVKLACDGVNWHLNGVAVSASAPTFADQ